MSSREIAHTMGLFQYEVNRVRKKHFPNMELFEGRRPNILTTWKKQYAIRLVTMGGVNIARKATRDLKRVTEVEMCDRILQNALKKA